MLDEISLLPLYSQSHFYSPICCCAGIYNHPHRSLATSIFLNTLLPQPHAPLTKCWSSGPLDNVNSQHCILTADPSPHNNGSSLYPFLCISSQPVTHLFIQFPPRLRYFHIPHVHYCCCPFCCYGVQSNQLGWSPPQRGWGTLMSRNLYTRELSLSFVAVGITVEERVNHHHARHQWQRKRWRIEMESIGSRQFQLAVANGARL